MSELIIAPKFTGSIPKSYDELLGPLMFEPYASDVGKLIDASRIQDALELASGTGRLTRHIRKAIRGDATLIASDLSPEMQAVAKDCLAGENIQWQIVDAQQLPFDNDSFDLVACYFGYMFVQDREQAYREALRVLRKGGMLLMATWDDLQYNGASFIFRTTLHQEVGDILPASYNLPFSMHNGNEIAASIKAAGFEKVDWQKVQKSSYAVSARVAANALVTGGSLYNEIVKRDTQLADKIIGQVSEKLAKTYGERPMQAPMSALVFRAWK